MLGKLRKMVLVFDWDKMIIVQVWDYYTIKLKEYISETNVKRDGKKASDEIEKIYKLALDAWIEQKERWEVWKTCQLVEIWETFTFFFESCLRNRFFNDIEVWEHGDEGEPEIYYVNWQEEKREEAYKI